MGGPIWDDDKNRRNLTKHGIAFIDAATALDDPDRVTWYDERHSLEEDRYVTVGTSRRGQLVVVVTSLTASQATRIISARRATKRERHAYEVHEPLD